MVFTITKVYQVVAADAAAARAAVTPVSSACQTDFESVQARPLLEQPSEARLFAREAVRQLTGITLGPTHKQEPRRES